jgi:hypothetical protein
MARLYSAGGATLAGIAVIGRRLHAVVPAGVLGDSELRSRAGQRSFAAARSGEGSRFRDRLSSALVAGESCR